MFEVTPLGSSHNNRSLEKISGIVCPPYSKGILIHFRVRIFMGEPREFTAQILRRRQSHHLFLVFTWYFRWEYGKTNELLLASRCCSCWSCCSLSKDRSLIIALMYSSWNAWAFTPTHLTILLFCIPRWPNDRLQTVILYWTVLFYLGFPDFWLCQEIYSLPERSIFSFILAVHACYFTLIGWFY